MAKRGSSRSARTAPAGTDGLKRLPAPDRRLTPGPRLATDHYKGTTTPTTTPGRTRPTTVFNPARPRSRLNPQSGPKAAPGTTKPASKGGKVGALLFTVGRAPRTGSPQRLRRRRVDQGETRTIRRTRKAANVPETSHPGASAPPPPGVSWSYVLRSSGTGPGTSGAGSSAKDPGRDRGPSPEGVVDRARTISPLAEGRPGDNRRRRFKSPDNQGKAIWVRFPFWPAAEKARAARWEIVWRRRALTVRRRGDESPGLDGSFDSVCRSGCPRSAPRGRGTRF